MHLRPGLGRAPGQQVASAWLDRGWTDPEWADREWTWPPGGPWPAAEGTRWRTDEWAPATTVRRPLVRFGRWTLIYRRPGC